MRSGAWAGLAVGAVALSIGVGVVANDIADARRAQDHAAAITGGDPAAG
jgi:hypothetical protein